MDWTHYRSAQIRDGLSKHYKHLCFSLFRVFKLRPSPLRFFSIFEYFMQSPKAQFILVLTLLCLYVGPQL